MPDYPQQLTQLLVYLDEIHASELKVLDVRKQTAITDYMIIVTGRSSRHTKSIAEYIMEKMKESGMASIGNHGMETGEWVLVDFGDYVVHIMQPDARTFYNLEGLWQES